MKWGAGKPPAPHEYVRLMRRNIDGASDRRIDWKVFRELRVTGLERFCQSVLAEVSQLATDTGQTSHQRYLAVFKLLQRRDEELADTFDAPPALDSLGAASAHPVSGIVGRG